MTRKTLRSVLAVLAAAMFIGTVAQAGPPLICHTFDIGNAKSLPWVQATDWRAVQRNYDLNRLTDDMLALLTADTPVLVRMETMRRAAIYAVWALRDREVGISGNEKIAAELLARLRARADKNPSDAPALFDFGYLTESYRQAGWQATKNVSGPGEGYAPVAKAATMCGDAAMHFAAALIAQHPTTQSAHAEHLQKAWAGAAANSLLERNLEQRFGKRMAKR